MQSRPTLHRDRVKVGDRCHLDLGLFILPFTVARLTPSAGHIWLQSDEVLPGRIRTKPDGLWLKAKCVAGGKVYKVGSLPVYQGAVFHANMERLSEIMEGEI